MGNIRVWQKVAGKAGVERTAGAGNTSKDKIKCLCGRQREKTHNILTLNHTFGHLVPFCHCQKQRMTFCLFIYGNNK